jgi:hypothetical protein
MGRYDKKGDGPYYPRYKPDSKLRERLKDTLDVILYCQEKKIKAVRLRDLMSDIFEYLERFEDFHYGISEKAFKMIDNKFNSTYITLDHGVPSKELIKELILNKPKNQEELLEFCRNHYFMCFITKKEDIKLNHKKLKQKMPDGWNGKWENWKSRYEEAEITLKVDPGV